MSRSRALPWILAGVSVAVASGLVVTAFNPAPHSGGDNAAYISLAHALVAEGAYVDAYDPARAPHTKYPPLFPALLAGLIAAGASTWTAFKALVAVLTVAGVGFTTLWAMRRVGAWGGFAVGTLVAASAAVVYYSHWVLSDPLFVLLTMIALWSLERRGTDPRWLAVGAAAALAAYFTRSAGLPLLVAILGWLALERRWRALGVTAVAFLVPALLWVLRAGGEGVGDYGSEFWLVDPYQPGLGTVGLTGLAGRALANAGAYLTRHGPAAIVGSGGPLLAPVGVVLVGAAAYGWLLRVRKDGPGPAELFLPLYIGLILVWPEVWGGDRFVLPLLPLVFVYGAATVRALTAGRGGLVFPVGGVAFALLLVPALGQWMGSVRDASACAAVVEAEGPFACYGPRVTEFVGAAAWTGAALPDGAAVMSRKPRIFYVMSGVPSRTFPFDPDPDVQLEEADRVGARYVLLDRWDGQALRFVGGAVGARPGAFCFVRGFGTGQGGATQLLGILPPELRREGASGGQDGVTVQRCPASYVAREPDPSAYASSASARVPLLSSQDR